MGGWYFAVTDGRYSAEMYPVPAQLTPLRGDYDLLTYWEGGQRAVTTTARYVPC